MASPEQVTLQEVVDLADAELWAFLRSEVTDLTPDEARELLTETLPGWGGRYEDAAATVAADLYEQRRFAAELDRAAPYEVRLAKPADEARWAILASWGLSNAAEAIDWNATFQKIVGGAHRTIADAHRNTTMRNAVADPGSRGWQRVGRGGSTCPFCRMLIGRGQVYDSATVRFRSHDNCRCAAESAFKSISTAELTVYGESRRKRQQTDEDRARVREWLKSDMEADPDKYGLP